MNFIGFELCSPAYYYLLFSLILIAVIVLIKLIYSIVFKMDIFKFLIIKTISLVFFVFLLNALCNNNLVIVSWILMSFLILGWICLSILPNIFPSFKF
jgi:hypothetical protein